MKKVEFTEMRSVAAGDYFKSPFVSWLYDESADKFKFALAIRSFFLGGVLSGLVEAVDLSTGFGEVTGTDTFPNYVLSFKGFNGGGFKIAFTKIMDALGAWI